MCNLNVLYCCDDNYVPYTTVSVCSLLTNNRNFDNINIYVILDGVSEENKQKLYRQINLFKANFFPIAADEIVQDLTKLDMPKYRNSYATYFRLFFDKYISENNEKLLYLDSDTIICGDLYPLISEDMGEQCIYVVQEALADKYKKMIGMSINEPYFNAGVLLINLKKWNQYKCKLKIVEHIKSVRDKYCCPDQDLLNIVLKDKVTFINPQYNFQPIHRLLNDIDYKKIYKMKSYYYNEELDIARKHPVILHTYRFLGAFPWHKNSLHPDTEIFDYYLKKSVLKGFEKNKAKVGLMVMIEKFLFIFMPRKLFFRLFKFVQEWSFKRQNKTLLGGK